jgi:16S rRNA (guanine527-N7)-methyltransferase
MRVDMEKYLQDKGIAMPPQAESLFRQYFTHLISENEKFNLTRITDEKEVYIKHFLDSLELLAWRFPRTDTVMDIGSGAGLPGFPLKFVCPSLSLTMLDSSLKRVSFLKNTAAQLGLTDVEAIHGRAEDLGQNPVYRERFTLVVSRAVARLNILSELALPFVAPGGYFAAYKGPDAPGELEEALGALSQLGGTVETLWPYALPHGLGQRTLVLIKKTGLTPVRFPRKAGMPEKRPLL